MPNLVIVESPAKCGKIQGFLGAGWRCIASMGHIRALVPDLESVGLDRDFAPKYEFMAEKAKALKALKEAAAEADVVYLAADDDREGEAIAYSVAVYLKLNPLTTPRAVFHEITERAVKAAVEAPRRIDMARVLAQQARAMLDMMIGFTMSPLLWKHVARGLSAGRCQTPALRLVVEREDAILGFKGTGCWRVGGMWLSGTASFPAQLDDDLEGEEDALNYLEMRQAEPRADVTENKVRPWTSQPPEPLITSTLQQQASALYGIGPKNCMSIAQKLYEAGHITYMRTDKAVLSEEAAAAAAEWIAANYGAEFVGDRLATGMAASLPIAGAPVEEAPAKAKKGGKKKKAEEAAAADAPKAQEAHEAIRPTHIELTALPDGAAPAEKRIYGLIWQRTVQSVMAAARGETCTVKFQADGDADLDFFWSATAKRTTFAGWQRAGKVADLDSPENLASPCADEETATAALWTTLTSLLPGTRIRWQTLKAQPHETKAPGRYTEATLVRELEKHGIGRPSTFASLIAAIQDKSYVEIRDIPGREVVLRTYSLDAGSADKKPVAAEVKRTVGKEKGKLVPTDLGRSALRFMLDHFADLFDYGFTAAMERELDEVAEGRAEWKGPLRTTWASYKDRYEALSATRATASGPTAGGSDRVSASADRSAHLATPGADRVREFGGGLKAVMSKKGPLLLIEGTEKTAFFGWPTGVAFTDLDEAAARAHVATASAAAAPLGIWRGEPVQILKGKFGPYAKAGGITASVKEGASIEEVCAALDAKAPAAGGAGAPTASPVSGQQAGCAEGAELRSTPFIKSYKEYELSGQNAQTTAYSPHKFGEYEVRRGPYGPYIMKPAIKQRKFVSLSDSALAKIDSFTEKDIADLYKAGLEAKSRGFGKKKAEK